MPESTSQSGGPAAGTIDFSRIEDPETRRAVRAAFQQMTDTMTRQQLEIEALIEVLLEKHLTSIGEIKRHMMRLHQKDARGLRLHDQLMMSVTAPGATKPIAH
jgi:hypothetical protein